MIPHVRRIRGMMDMECTSGLCSATKTVGDLSDKQRRAQPTEWRWSRSNTEAKRKQLTLAQLSGFTGTLSDSSSDESGFRPTNSVSASRSRSVRYGEEETIK